MKCLITIFGFAAALMIAGGASGQTQDEDMAAVELQLAMIPPLGGKTLASFADGPFNALARKDREIVKAICEAQLDSRRDKAGAKLLDRDEIVEMKTGTGWRGVFRKLRKGGRVTGRSLRQAVRAYNRGASLPPSYTVISMGTGQKIIVAQQGRASRLNRKGKPVVTMGVGSAKRGIVNRAAGYPGGAVVTLASGSTVTISPADH